MSERFKQVEDFAKVFGFLYEVKALKKMEKVTLVDYCESRFGSFRHCLPGICKFSHTMFELYTVYTAMAFALRILLSVLVGNDHLVN